jgi:hypothetical protein
MNGVGIVLDEENHPVTHWESPHCALVHIQGMPDAECPQPKATMRAGEARPGNIPGTCQTPDRRESSGAAGRPVYDVVLKGSSGPMKPDVNLLVAALGRDADFREESADQRPDARPIHSSRRAA